MWLKGEKLRISQGGDQACGDRRMAQCQGVKQGDDLSKEVKPQYKGEK
jgi:hypothetical protein